ncbi:oligosaccharyl transferase, archaeosortase A system-associated [Halobacteriales archaeon QS_1_68_17]|nr:MAG: oligosaccharyl transferase, archaeosortase A system-associated [Halobacteriales archaeon QS_1_68_17]
MSQWRGRFEDLQTGTALERVRAWYHVPALVVLLAYMLWTRARSWQNFIRDGEVLFSGNDPWYHLRMVTYTVRNWPATMPFDPYTYYPYGTHASQFGTLFDQLMAVVALVLGLGDPSGHTIRLVMLFAPAVLGTLVALPVYGLGRRLGGRFGGIVGVLVLALSAGGFLNRSLVGTADHHVAEVLFQFTAILAVVVALSVANREQPVWELVTEREASALRRPVGWAALAGVAIALYLWTWSPGVLLIGILGVYFVVQLCAEYVRGRSPEHLAFAGVVMLGVAAVLVTASLETTAISAIEYSLLQPGLALAVAAGCVFLAWLARRWERLDLPVETAWSYPGAVLAILLAGAGTMALVLPDLFDYFVDQVLRIVGLSTSPTGGTVGEVQPLSRPVSTFFQRYGLAYLTAGAGALLALVQQVREDDASPGVLLVVIWGVFLLMATLTQRRFDYYLVGPIAVLNAYFVGQVLRFVSPDAKTASIETYQVLTVLAVLLVVTAPIVLVTSGAGGLTIASQTKNAGPGAGIEGWEPTLDWMANETPRPGQYEGANNEIAYYGTLSSQDDYDYQAGSYGVMSWWDYGHWITAEGERIPNANPFQEGATTAAKFLLSQNESEAASVVGGEMAEAEGTRYVAVDWKMASVYGRYGGKFFAPTVFAPNVSRSDFFQPVVRPTRQGARLAYYHRSQKYYNSMSVRLWLFHGSAVSPRPVVTDWDTVQTRNGPVRVLPRNGQSVRFFDSMQAARQFVREDGTAQVGGVGPNPSERIPALEHYRLVRNSNASAGERGSGYLRGLQTEARSLNLTGRRASQTLLPTKSPAWVKIFERVPGGTIRGQGPPNTNVSAQVQMYSPETNSTFTYRQRVRTDDEGNFEMTVPYSTTGYEKWGTSKGYTNVSVRARSSYVFSTGVQQGPDGNLSVWRGRANVTEGQVIGENETATTVTLQEQVIQTGNDGGNQTNGNGTNATADGSGTNTTDAAGEPTPTPTPSSTDTAGSLDGSGLASRAAPEADANRIAP